MKKNALLLLILVFLTSCCKLKQFADLLIPELLYIFDQYGNPVLDNNNEQVFDYNNLFYNYRSSELFTLKTGPKLGVLVGDILDIGTRVFNDWTKNHCNGGLDAPNTMAKPVISYFGNFGNGVLNNLSPSFTPGIFLNSADGAFTYTNYTFTSPNRYSFDFDANYDRSLGEWTYDNNLLSDNAMALNVIRVAQPVLEVIDNPNPTEQWYDQPILPSKILNETQFIKQSDWGTNEATYLNSPLARFMQDPKNIIEFYKFKSKNPDKPFILH